MSPFCLLPSSGGCPLLAGLVGVGTLAHHLTGARLGVRGVGCWCRVLHVHVLCVQACCACNCVFIHAKACVCVLLCTSLHRRMCSGVSVHVALCLSPVCTHLSGCTDACRLHLCRIIE